jgi:hypothetical protein
MMSVLAKLNLKTVQRSVAKDPVTARREKLILGVEQQLRLVDAALNGENFVIKFKRKVVDDAGAVVEQVAEKRARAWYFEQDRGYYVQCRYGARILMLNGKNNAVWVATLKEVAGVLAAFKEATLAGELDKAVAMAMVRANG